MTESGKKAKKHKKIQQVGVIMTTGLLSNWPNSQGFSEANVHQRNSQTGECFTEGADFLSRTKEYKVEKHQPTGSFFPVASNSWSLGQDVAYIFAFPLHKVLTTVAQGGFILWEGGLACKTAFYDKTQAFSEAAKPAFEQLKAYRRDAAIVGVPLILRHWQPALFGLGIYNSIWWLAAAGAVGAIAYAAFDPKGMKVHVAEVERMINVRPLDDHRVSQLDQRAKVFSILDGSFSLSRLLGMHRIGKLSDKCDDGSTPRFEHVETETKSK